jgi:hypothetical protein
MQAAAVGTWRNGLLVSHKGYANTTDALADLGVVEDALSPSEP